MLHAIALWGGWISLAASAMCLLSGRWFFAALLLVIGIIKLTEGYRVSHILGFKLWWVKEDVDDTPLS